MPLFNVGIALSDGDTVSRDELSTKIYELYTQFNVLAGLVDPTLLHEYSLTDEDNTRADEGLRKFESNPEVRKYNLWSSFVPFGNIKMLLKGADVGSLL